MAQHRRAAFGMLAGLIALVQAFGAPPPTTTPSTRPSTKPAAPQKQSLPRFVIYGNLSGEFAGNERELIRSRGHLMVGLDVVRGDGGSITALRPLFATINDIVANSDRLPPASPLADGFDAAGAASLGEVAASAKWDRSLAPPGHVVVGLSVRTHYGIDGIRIRYGKLSPKGDYILPNDPLVDTDWLGHGPSPDDDGPNPKRIVKQVELRVTPDANRPVLGLYGTGAITVGRVGVVGLGRAIEVSAGPSCPFALRPSLAAARESAPGSVGARTQPDDVLRTASGAASLAASIELASRLIERDDEASLREARQLLLFAAQNPKAPPDVVRAAACVLAAGVGGEPDPENTITMVAKLVPLLDEPAIGYINSRRQDLLWKLATRPKDIPSANGLPPGSLLVMEGRVTHTGSSWVLLRGKAFDAPAEPKMAFEGANLGGNGRLVEVLCRARGKGSFRAMATHAQEPRYALRHEVVTVPAPNGQRFEAKVTIRNTGVQPLRIVRLLVLDPRDDRARPLGRGEINDIPPGGVGETRIPIGGPDMRNGGRRVPAVEVSVDSVDW